MFRPSFKNLSSPSYFLEETIIFISPGAHTIHFSVPISFFSLAGTTRVVIIFCCLQITHHLQTIHKKREKASARAVECKRSEAKLIRNSSRENFIHTQIEFDIHATRIYQSGSFLFSRVHFIILFLRLFGEKANLRATWAENGVPGYVAGDADEGFRCQKGRILHH